MYLGANIILDADDRIYTAEVTNADQPRPVGWVNLADFGVGSRDAGQLRKVAAAFMEAADSLDTANRPVHTVTVEGSPPSEPMMWTARCTCGDRATASTPGMAESALAGHEQGVMPVEVA